MLVAEGLNDEEALSVAQTIMAECNSRLANIAECGFSRMRMVAGLGRLRAARLMASIELGRRVVQAEGAQHDTISSDQDVVRVMRPIIGALPHEECWVLYLNNSGKILERQRISQGGVQATVVDCRLILRRALELLAVQIVLIHNHPSGTAEPSRQDIDLTERVAQAAKLLDITLLDHVIITRDVHYSFRGHNLVLPL